MNLQLLDVPAVGIDLDGGQHLAALVVVPVSELVAGGEGLHAQFGEKLLVMVGTGAANEEHGPLSLGSGADVFKGFFHLEHLLCDDRFDLVDELLVSEIVGDFPKGFGGGPGADKIDLDPEKTVFFLHHLGHVFDRRKYEEKIYKCFKYKNKNVYIFMM